VSRRSDVTETALPADPVASIISEVIDRRAAGEAVPDDALIAKHPELMPELGRRLRELRQVEDARQVAEQAMQSPGLAPTVAVPSDEISTQESPGSGGPERRWMGVGDPSAVRWDGPPADSIPGYQIIRELHRGGQGVVYQAVQQSTRKKVAIKVMREGPFAGPADRARFEREVQILAGLKHPNIITIYDSGSSAGGFYYVMDYIAGQSLDTYVAGRARTVDDVLQLFAKVCEAVNAAHVRGVTHRDLKPGNILVGPDDEPYILDFGLAKMAIAGTGIISGREGRERILDPASGAEGRRPELMSVTGQFIGSLPWASPEQAEGNPAKIDLRTDVYALGVILYHLLTDRFPYEVMGQVRDVLNNILSAEPARPLTFKTRVMSATSATGDRSRRSRRIRLKSQRINDEIETIVLKCLSKERDRRYQTAGELAADVRRYLAGQTIVAKRDSTWYVLRKLAARNKAATVVAAAVAVILLSYASTGIYLYQQTQVARRDRAQVQALAQDQAQIMRPLGSDFNELVPHMALGWFLFEWSHDRLDRAEQIRDQMPPESPMHTAMGFLLDDSHAPDRLLEALPKHRSLAYYVIGERHLKAGRTDAALRAFALSLRERGDDWIKAAAQNRVERLAAQPDPPPAGP